MGDSDLQEGLNDASADGDNDRAKELLAAGASPDKPKLLDTPFNMEL